MTLIAFLVGLVAGAAAVYFFYPMIHKLKADVAELEAKVKK